MDEKEEQSPEEDASENENLASSAVAAIDNVAPAGWRMKFAQVVAQLIAGTEKGSLVYGQMRERMDTIEGRSVVSKALASAVAEQAVNDPELLERAKARYLGTAIQQQENLEAVIDGATQYLPMLPAPNDSKVEHNSKRPSQDVPETPADPGFDDRPLDADWAATFSGIAENASTEELQDRLSRVLAGELASPGTYGRATVRAIADLERSDLQAMQAALPFVLDNSLFPTPGDPQQPTIEELLLLSEAGLILDANAMLSRVSKAATSDAEPFYHGGKDWGLIIYMNTGQKFRIPFVPLTRTGIAVADLLGRPDERAILKRIAGELPQDIYSRVIIGQKTGPTGIGGIVEQIFPQTDVSSILSGGPTLGR